MPFADALFLYRAQVETLYTLVLVAAALFVAWRVNGYHRLSGHTGLRLFRDAFVFFGLGYLVRYVTLLLVLHGALWAAYGIVLFSYLLGLASFSLVRSLTWHERAIPGWAMHVAALVIAVADILAGTEWILYVAYLALFSYAAVASYRGYRASRRPMRQLSFIAMVLFWLGWAANFAADLLDARYPGILLYAYATTAAIMLLFAYGVARRR